MLSHIGHISCCRYQAKLPFHLPCATHCTGSTFHNGSPTRCACWRINVFIVWHRTTWPISVVVLGCNHLMPINCSSHGHVQLLLVRAPSTSPDQHPGTLYLLCFMIWQSHWEPLGRCWNRFCSNWQMCIGHGIRVAAHAFVTFVKGYLKCLLLLLLYLGLALSRMLKYYPELVMKASWAALHNDVMVCWVMSASCILKSRLIMHLILPCCNIKEFTQNQHGNDPPRRPSNTWITQLEQDTGIPADQLWTLAVDRREWAALWLSTGSRVQCW